MAAERKRPRVEWIGEATLRVVCPVCGRRHQLEVINDFEMLQDSDDPGDKFQVNRDSEFVRSLHPIWVCLNPKCSFEAIVRFSMDS
jgi:hypothetical protein